MKRQPAPPCPNCNRLMRRYGSDETDGDGHRWRRYVCAGCGKITKIRIQ